MAERDRIVETEDGWCCIVNGQSFGTWMTRALAKAGMEVEQRRAAERASEVEQSK
jgi:hypothetical protein